MKALRKPIAIIFLFLISLQVGGYYAVMEYMKQQLSEKTATRLAAEQAPLGAQLVLKIPVTSGLESRFTYEGNVYHVIEQHIYQNVRYVVCIRDDGATHAQETIESFVQSLAGNTNDHSSGIRLFENLTKYFFTEGDLRITATTGWIASIPFGMEHSFYSFNEEDLPFHPPSARASFI